MWCALLGRTALNSANLCVQVLALGYSKFLKELALLAMDKNMITSDWVWIGSNDVLGSENANIPGNQRLSDAKRAFSIQMSIHICARLCTHSNRLHTYIHRRVVICPSGPNL